MRIVRITISVFLLGLLIFYKSAVFGTRAWDWMYYFWDKTCSSLLWLSIYLLVQARYKKIIALVLTFSLIRLTWEVISFFTGVSINNIRVVAILFTVLVIVILVMFIMETIWQKAK